MSSRGTVSEKTLVNLLSGSRTSKLLKSCAFLPIFFHMALLVGPIGYNVSLSAAKTLNATGQVCEGPGG